MGMLFSAVIFCTVLVLLIDNLLSQWASLATLLHSDDMSVISILLCSVHHRDPLLDFRKLVQSGNIQRPYASGDNDAKDTAESTEFLERLGESVEEVRTQSHWVKGQVMRLFFLPLRHIAGLICIWALLAMALQLQWDGGAFRGIHFENVGTRTAVTYAEDLLECFYFSVSTASSITYGEISPDVAADEEARHNCSRKLKSTFWIRLISLIMMIIVVVTILGTFNVAFRSVGELMKILNNEEELRRVITFFVTSKHAYPLIK